MRTSLCLLCAAAAICAAAAQGTVLEAELAELRRDIAAEVVDSAVERLGSKVIAVAAEQEREKDAAGTHDWCVLLTATVSPFVDVTNIVHHDLGKDYGPQKNVNERRQTYEQSVAAWAEKSNLPIVFAENSGADLSSIQAKVPSSRANFEFLHIPVTSGARVEIGIHEALGVIEAVKKSKLLQKCDKVLKVTGRYFIHDAQSVLKNCPQNTHIAIQHPKWKPLHNRQETQVFGFKKAEYNDVFGWALRGEGCMECHATDLVREWKGKEEKAKTICDLPSMEIDPVKEGSTQILRESVSADSALSDLSADLELVHV